MKKILTFLQKNHPHFAFSGVILLATSFSVNNPAASMVLSLLALNILMLALIGLEVK